MSAFLNSGRSDTPKSTEIRVRFRPEAVIAGHSVLIKDHPMATNDRTEDRQRTDR